MKNSIVLFLAITFFTSSAFSQDSLFIKQEAKFTIPATDHQGQSNQIIIHSFPISHVTFNEKYLEFKLPDHPGLKPRKMPYPSISAIRLHGSYFSSIKLLFAALLTINHFPSLSCRIINTSIYLLFLAGIRISALTCARFPSTSMDKI